LASPDNSSSDPQPTADSPSPPDFLAEPDSNPPRILQPGTIPLQEMTPPIEDPPWNGWDVLLLVGLTLVTILVAQFAILFGAHYLFFPRRPLSDLAQWPMVLLISQFLIDGAVGILLYLLIEGKYRVPFWRSISWNWPSSEWRLLGLGAVMLLALSMLENFLPMPKEVPFDKLFARPRDAYLLAIIAVSLGPLVEELFFRGFFYPVLARRWGAGWGVFLSALPFALMHLPQYGYAWAALLVVLIVGLVCGMVRAVTRSVGASFLVHVGYNGTQMLIALVWTRGFNHMPKSLLHF
jgi:membrane protease YdiL (CAAX protease family)